MDLLRSWITAVAVYLVAGLVIAGTAVNAPADARGISSGGTFHWNALPALATFFAMVVLAAAAHPAAARRRPVRHAAAILAAPAVAFLAEIVHGVSQGSAGGAAFGAGGAIAGTAAALGLLGLLRRRRKAH